MTVRNRKKNSRMRGRHTHGWGSKKKRRGSGNRGGKGMAGTGKRSDAVKPSIWNQDYFGKRGFVSRKKLAGTGSVINVSQLCEQVDRLVANGSAKLEGDSYSVNLADIGCAKLLGRGNVTKKLVVTVMSASAAAVESVEASGGRVITRRKE